MINEKIRSGNKDVDAYIKELEKEVSFLNGSNTRKLIRSIDNFAYKISSEMDLIAKDQKNPDGTEVELSGKIVNIYLSMVKEADKIKNFADMIDSFNNSTTVETVSKTETVTEKKTVKNKFEEIQDKIKNENK